MSVPIVMIRKRAIVRSIPTRIEENVHWVQNVSRDSQYKDKSSRPTPRTVLLNPVFTARSTLFLRSKAEGYFKYLPLNRSPPIIIEPITRKNKVCLIIYF